MIKKIWLKAGMPPFGVGLTVGEGVALGVGMIVGRDVTLAVVIGLVAGSGVGTTSAPPDWQATSKARHNAKLENFSSNCSFL